MKVRPFSDWIVAKLEAKQELSGSIIVPDSHEEAILKGTVIAVGPGKTDNNGITTPVGVEVGEKICFLRWHKEHRPGKAQVAALSEMSAELGAEVVLVRQADVLVVYEGDLHVELTH
jgi:chaperonin GroES